MKEDQKEVIKAWIDGATIQCKCGDSDWYDIRNFEDYVRVYFNDDSIYRIKPKEIVTTTYIKRDFTYGLHATYSGALHTHNLILTWSPDGETLLKAEVI